MRFLRPLGYIAAGAIIGLGAATAYNNIGSIKQKFSYPTSSATQTVSGAAKLAAKEREHEEKQTEKPASPGKKEIAQMENSATLKESTFAAIGSKTNLYCNSSYHNPSKPEEASAEQYGLTSGKIICAFEGSAANPNAKIEKVALVETDGNILVVKHEEGREIFRYTLESGLDIEEFEITWLDKTTKPYITVLGSKEGYKRFIMLTYEGQQIVNGRARHIKLKDINEDGEKELVVIGSPDRTGLVHIYEWYPAVNTPAGGHFSSEVFDMSVRGAKHHLTEAVRNENIALIKQVKDNNNPYAFITAFDGVVREIMPHASVNDLYRELFGMEPSAFLDRFAKDPLSLGTLVATSAMFAERFVYHVQTRNDKFIRPTGSGYGVSLDGKTGPCCFSTIEEARREVLNMQRREQQQANAPSSYHTSTTTTYDPKTGVTSEKRTTSVGGPPQTPTQRETGRAVQKDPIARGLNETYQRAGAVKGEAEKKAGEVSREVGKKLNEAAGNIGRAFEDAKRRR